MELSEWGTGAARQSTSQPVRGSAKPTAVLPFHPYPSAHHLVGWGVSLSILRVPACPQGRGPQLPPRGSPVSEPGGDSTTFRGCVWPQHTCHAPLCAHICTLHGTGPGTSCCYTTCAKGMHHTTPLCHTHACLLLCAAACAGRGGCIHVRVRFLRAHGTCFRASHAFPSLYVFLQHTQAFPGEAGASECCCR